MYDIVQKAHSGFAYLALLALILTVINSLFGLFSKRVFSSFDRKIAITTLSLMHTQFLIGLNVWFLSPLGMDALGQLKNATLRLTALEHPITNTIAIILITVGWVKHKKLIDSTAKFKTFFIYYGLGLVFILVQIPWKLWLQN